jgi:hypothetical protein
MVNTIDLIGGRDLV